VTNLEIIRKKFENFRQSVHEGGNLALREQMSDVLDLSVNLHEQLEGGYHTHHTLESDTHGWAVADRNGVIASGASELEMPNEYGSAEEDAKREAVTDNPGQKGVFSAIMVYPFEGDSERDEDSTPMLGEPHDSVRFEEKIQELLKVHAHQWLPTFFRKNVRAAIRK
jgi:hypothetical protein